MVGLLEIKSLNLESNCRFLLATSKENHSYTLLAYSSGRDYLDKCLKHLRVCVIVVINVVLNYC